MMTIDLLQMMNEKSIWRGQVVETKDFRMLCAWMLRIDKDFEMLTRGIRTIPIRQSGFAVQYMQL